MSRTLRNAGLAVGLMMLMLLSVTGAEAAAPPGAVTGIVRDGTGAVIPKAEVSLLTGEQTMIAATRTDGEGRYAFNSVAAGRYVLAVSFPGFSDRRLAVTVASGATQKLDVTLDVTPVEAEVTVRSTIGVAENASTLSQPVNLIDSTQILERAKAVIGQVALEEAGVHLLRTSPTMAGIYVRGMTGNKVSVFIDGVRYSTAAARGGVNTFLDLIEPTSLQGVEILRGPNSAQYGSDAIGGSVQFLSQIPTLSSTGDGQFRGSFGTRANSADSSYGANLSAQYSTARFGLLASTAARRINKIRPGQGIDSHAAVTRFLGVSSDRLMSDRLPDTEFTQYGGMLKFNWVPSASDQVVVSYQRNQQDGGKRYDQLLGGDGNLIADLRNLMGDVFYIKYNRIGVGPFDQITATYSFNSQREERVNQGGNGNPTASITHEFERTNVHGFQARAMSIIGGRQEVLVGFDLYPEHVQAPSFSHNPVTNATAVRRGRVPDGATFLSWGVFVQDAIAVVPGRLRVVGDLRYSGARYESKASDSPIVNGKPLWPDDSLKVSSLTFRAGVVGTIAEGLNLTANVSRGFRAPHITDLGTVGLTGSGFQVSGNAVQNLGAMVGTTAGATAVSSGKAVEDLKPETSLSWETGLSYRSSTVSTAASVFVNTVKDNIVYQALILPQGAVGRVLGDQTITSQGSTGVVYVPASSSPVLVRTNYGDARITGLEHTFDWRFAPRFSVSTVLTLLHAKDIATGLAPNIEGGTPGADFYLKLRYSHPGGRFWLEPYIHAAGKQTRLSSLDLEDRRTGAPRTRSSIRNFFLNGATSRGWVSAGPDGVRGTADDLLTVTGETLAQIQDRVLGVGVSSAPLYTAVPSYTTANVRGGFRLGTRHDFMVELENLTDKNYRGIAWGLDATGRSLSISYQTRF
jgi:hemoglobin/transferrin/lactoferrin receptor protein